MLGSTGQYDTAYITLESSHPLLLQEFLSVTWVGGLGQWYGSFSAILGTEQSKSWEAFAQGCNGRVRYFFFFSAGFW